MPITMRCPNGHQLVTEDQYAGRKVRCPHCQAVVVVPGAPQTAVTAAPAKPPPRPERGAIDEGDVIADEDVISDEDILDDEDDRPRRRRQRADREDDYEDEERPRRKKKKKSGMTRQQMSLTNLGLGFHYAKILTILISIAVSIVGALLAGAAGASAVNAGPGGAASAGGAMALAGVVVTISHIAMFFAAPALGITGSILCCWVPSKTGGKPLVITSLALDSAALVLPIISIIILGAGAALRGAGAGAGAVGLVFLLLSPLCSLAGFILFMLFLRQLARFLDDDGSADEAMSIIIHFLILVIGGPLTLIALIVVMSLIVTRNPSGAGVGAVGCVFSLILLAASITLFVFIIKLLFRILNLIGSLRQALRTRYGV